jgi:hypothetical protein
MDKMLRLWHGGLTCDGSCHPRQIYGQVPLQTPAALGAHANTGYREITMAQPGIPATLSDRRWVILSVVVVAQLMVVLDSTIVNITLPSAQRALGFPGRSERPH